MSTGTKNGWDYRITNLPVVPIDALQFGLPIMAANWRSIPEVVKQNINGILVETKYIEQVSESLETLINKKDMRFKMGQESKEMYKKNYSEDLFSVRMNIVIQYVVNS